MQSGLRAVLDALPADIPAARLAAWRGKLDDPRLVRRFRGLRRRNDVRETLDRTLDKDVGLLGNYICSYAILKLFCTIHAGP